MGGRGFFCAVVGCTSAVWVVCRQSPEEWGRGGETAAATIAATALCRAADRQSQRLRSRGGETGCSRGRDARNDISDRGPSLHVLRTMRAGRLWPRVLHGRGVEGRAPKSCGRCGVEGKGLRVLRTPCAGRSNPRILHGRGRKVEERRREDAELRDGRGEFLPAVTCGRSCAPGLPRRSRDRGSAGRGPSRPSP